MTRHGLLLSCFDLQPPGQEDIFVRITNSHLVYLTRVSPKCCKGESGFGKRSFGILEVTRLRSLSGFQMASKALNDGQSLFSMSLHGKSPRNPGFFTGDVTMSRSKSSTLVRGNPGFLDSKLC